MARKHKDLCLYCRLIASASFDKSVRLWRASDGHFICTFRGHVQAVYSVAWAADSRLFVTGSKDSTLKGKNTHFFRKKFICLNQTYVLYLEYRLQLPNSSLECER